MPSMRIAGLNICALIITVFALGCELKPPLEVHGLTKVLYDLSDSFQARKFNSRIPNPDYPNHYLGRYVQEDSTYFVFWSGISRDSFYNVYGSCLGEFGGSVVFRDRNDSSKIHLISATCPQQIERIDSGYLIMSSLAHMSGFSSINLIGDPTSCLTFPTDSVIDEFISLDDSIYQLQNGIFKNQHRSDTLIEVGGYMFSITFEKNNRRYAVCSDSYKTYLAEIKNKEMVIIDTLMRFPSWSYGHNWTTKIDDGYLYNYYGHYHVHYSDESSTPFFRFAGKVVVREDTIHIGHNEKFFASQDEMHESKPIY
jgi:hypothetical protein